MDGPIKLLIRMSEQLTDWSDGKVAGKTRAGTEGSGMERADPDVDDWGRAERKRSGWADAARLLRHAR